MADTTEITVADPQGQTTESIDESQTEAGENGKNGTTETKETGVTVEQFEALKRMQAASDTKVQELLNQIKERDEATARAEQERADSKKTQAEKNAAAIARLQKERDDANAAAHAERLRSSGISALTTAGAPIELDGFSPIDFLVGKDAETTAANVDGFQKYLDAYFVQRQKPNLQANGRTPQTSATNSDKYYSMGQLQNMSPAEMEANREKVDESLRYLEQTQ